MAEDKKGRRIKKVKNLREAAELKGWEGFVELEDYSLDLGAMQLIAKRKRLKIHIDISPLFTYFGIRRTKWMGKIRRFVNYAIKKGVLISIDTKDISDLTDEEKAAVCVFIGMNRGQGRNAVKLGKMGG